jgi:hypothetical protein
MEEKYQLSYLATTSQTTGRIAPEQRSASHRNAGRHQIGTAVAITPESRSAWAGIRSRSGPWAMSRRLATHTGLTNQKLKEQGLLSVKDLWVKIHYPATAR